MNLKCEFWQEKRGEGRVARGELSGRERRERRRRRREGDELTGFEVLSLILRTRQREGGC